VFTGVFVAEVPPGAGVAELDGDGVAVELASGAGVVCCGGFTGTR